MKRESKLLTKLQTLFPWLYNLFLKIAEPRVVRLLHFGIYICMLVGGSAALFRTPQNFTNLIGWALSFMLGLFIFFGAMLSAIAVLPGIWWLERVGLIALTTGMAMYIVTIIALGASPLGFVVPIAFALTFALRWIEIRRYQLAPREE